jgi:hypothetical protein
VYARNQCSKASQGSPQLKSGRYGLVRGASSPRQLGWGTPGLVIFAGREATVNACGVTVARPQGQSWAPNLPIGYE